MTDDALETSSPKPDPNEELVRVFDTAQESEALVVQGLLQSAGIESDITSLDMSQEVFPGIGGTIILVRAENEAEARRVIAESKESSIDQAEVNTEPAA